MGITSLRVCILIYLVIQEGLKMGIKIVSVQIVDICSKHRSCSDIPPKNKFGVTYEDKDIACVGCMLGDKNAEE